MAERCGHCGREGTLEHVEEVALSRRIIQLRHGPNNFEEVDEARVLNVRRCTVCEEPTLATYKWLDGYSDPEDPLAFRQIYPSRRTLEDLPERVRQRYVEMLEIAHAPDAFAVRAGRLLEAVCTDQGVTEGLLGPRLDQLAGKKLQTIPTALAEQAHLVREYRNVGGHDKDIEVFAEDVPLIRDFVEGLLEFLYWGPAKLDRGRAALAQRLQADQ